LEVLFAPVADGDGQLFRGTFSEGGEPVFVEGESKKIGQVQVPEALIARMRASPCVRLETDIETRVTLLLQEYEFFVTNQESLYEQLDCLVSLHGREKLDAWKALAARGQWREFVARLLVEHYDPAYRRSSLRNFMQLPDARAVRIASADDAAFGRAAQSLLASPELQPA